MILTNSDCLRNIASYLPLNKTVMISLSCRRAQDILTPRDADRCRDTLKKTYLLLHPAPPRPLPAPAIDSGWLKFQESESHLLAFYSDHMKLHKRVNGQWNYFKKMVAPQYNHRLWNGHFILNVGLHNIVLNEITENNTLLLLQDIRHPVLLSKSVFCYVAQNKTVVHTEKEVLRFDFLGTTFLHETNGYLHFITPNLIFHYNLETRQMIEERISISKVLSTDGDILNCETAIIQLSKPKSRVIFEKRLNK